MGDETLFSYEASGSRQEVAASLRAVAAKLSGTGPITLAAGEARVTVAPGDDLEFEVEVEREEGDDGDAVELEFELEWTETGTDEVRETRQTTDSPQTTESADAPGQADEEADGEAGASSTVDFDAVAAPDETGRDVAESAGSQATFEVFRDAAGEWRWRLVHRNGNVVATSGEGYARRRNAEKGLRSVVTNAPEAEVVDDLQ